ncbi:cytochrome c oxidase subunit 3 [Carboxylicivirga mesophila]|uniref:Cytochrome c oxidase subunit 3 n=2 Tax=Carboxylicivirga TaxID=1628153 RepID=A0A941F2U9_9BACT|nr:MULTISPECIES: cytochrome c oxidase subunit 3 [Carboxylicivirga]MBR8534730.1 cytochrome c oxidase subunit 3 [Carboxylicivirga sediminis]MBS2210646.1 cytochrome c oxidase subunit 3 [Carboxylicivirga mesophila]
MSQSLSMAGNLSEKKESTLSGIWLFIFIELLLFAGLFLLYGVYRYKNPVAFDLAAGELSITSGVLNTIIILGASLGMAYSSVAIRKGNKMATLFWLLTTLFIGFMFLVNRYFEWKGRIDFGFFPGSEELARLGHGDVLFFGLYFFMTGLHAIHLLVGFIGLIYVTSRVNNNSLNGGNYALLEKTGSYWHLATLIWVLIFPLFYLL